MKAGVLLVLGEDRFLAREAVRAELAKHDTRDVSRVRGPEAELAAILDEVRTPSLLSAGRVVAVEEAGPLLDSEGLAAVAAFAKNPVSGALLVLQTEKLDKRLKATKELLQTAQVVECAPLKPRQVPGWVGQRARSQHGLQVGAEPAHLLVERIGEDLGELDAALDRLRDQIAPRTRLETADVATSTEDHRSPILFEAANALEDGNLEGALQAIDAAFAEGIRIRQDVVTEPGGIAQILLANLHGTYRTLLRYQMTGDARKAGVHPMRARFFVQKAARHPLARLVARHGLFVEADLALKSARADPKRTLEHLLVGLLNRAS